MSKYPCGLIEDVLPLYIESDVSEETKEIVEKHLKECEKCRALVQEYSDDEIKIDDLKEDLPQANTYKKWMKKLKAWAVIIIAVTIVVATAIGIIGYKIGENPKNDLLTLRKIVKTLEKKGVDLEEDKTRDPEGFDLEGVKPTIYSVGDKKGTLLIYVFKSIGQRQDIADNPDKLDYFYSPFERPFNAKNAILIYLVPEDVTTEEEYKPIGETMSLVSDIVFKDLNDGKVVIYKGESESWEGTFTIKYYEHFGQEESGKTRYDSYKWEYPEIKYKNSDIESIGPVDFQYKTNLGGGSSTGSKPNKDGYVSGGIGGGNGAITKNEQEISFTIKWNDKEENIKLKIQQ